MRFFSYFRVCSFETSLLCLRSILIVFRYLFQFLHEKLLPLYAVQVKNFLIVSPNKGLQLFEKISWVGGNPPIAEPECGFRGEKCISYAKEISAAIAGIILLVLTIVSLVLYRNWRYEQELDSLLWKIDFKDIQMHENDSSGVQKPTRATHPLIRTSQVSLSSNPDADFRYSTIFTPIGLYKGQLYAIKKIRKKSVDITREMKMELKVVSNLSE